MSSLMYFDIYVTILDIILAIVHADQIIIVLFLMDGLIKSANKLIQFKQFYLLFYPVKYKKMVKLINKTNKLLLIYIIKII